MVHKALVNCTCRHSNRSFIFHWSVFVDVDGSGLDVPPGSHSSVRSSGDGSSCDTPPVNQCTSSTDDGRIDRGKYCDCCYCELFGYAAVSEVTMNIMTQQSSLLCTTDVQGQYGTFLVREGGGGRKTRRITAK